MMRIPSIAPVVAGVLAVAAIGLVTLPVRADDTPVTLKYTTKTGDSLHQQIVITVPAFNAVVTQKQKRMVKEVSDTGNVTLVVTDEGSKLTVGGADQDSPGPNPDITVKRDKLGKLTDWKPAKEIDNPQIAPEVMRAEEQMYTLIMPANPVKAKDTWKVELDNPVYDKQKIKVESTFVGIDKVDGVDMWKVKQSAVIQTNEKGDTTTFDGTFWLNPATGQLAKLEGTVKGLPTVALGNLDVNVSVLPIKDGAAPAPDKKAPV